MKISKPIPNASGSSLTSSPIASEGELADLSWKTAWEHSPGPRTTKEYGNLIFKGVCMGTADVIPGVSGGTVAFVMGIYESLLASIASIDRTFFTRLIQGNFKQALAQLHLRFLLPLGFGIVLAILSTSRLMTFLLKNHPIPTWSLFLGLISASVIVVFRSVERPHSPQSLFFLIAGTLFGYGIVGLIPISTPETWWFVMLSGSIGICAMILPGISGAFLLLMLGKYEYILSALHNPFLPSSMITLFSFLVGVSFGLLGFSKILKFLLKNFHNATLCFLTGLMIGSLRKVWPWKKILESKIIGHKVYVLREANIIPETMTPEVFYSIGLIIFGFMLVLGLEKLQKFLKS